MTITQITDLNLTDKRVFIRSDMNVPIKNNKVVSDTRICASLPTIKNALEQGARVMITSHLGRPTEGKYDKNFSLQPIVNYLKEKLPYTIRLVKDYLDGVDIAKGELLVLENVRFNKGEKENDEVLARKYAALCDVFVMDAFGAAHRTHASTHGVIKFSPVACAGILLSKEIKVLSKVLNNPDKPMVAIIGGSKVSTKLFLIESLSKITDQLIIGGGIANTLIAAKGYNIGKSFYEANLISEAKHLTKNSNIFIPIDVRVTTKFSKNATANLRLIDSVQDSEYILDLGEISITHIKEVIKNAKTILWNGPVGVFEFINFSRGTEMIARTITNSEAFSIVGGGDTLAALELFKVTNRISYISTGGGAFLEFIEGKKLPVIAMLEKCAKK